MLGITSVRVNKVGALHKISDDLMFAADRRISAMAACASTRLGRCERNVYAHKRKSQADNAIFSEQSGDKEPGTADRIHKGSSTVYR